MRRAAALLALTAAAGLLGGRGALTQSLVQATLVNSPSTFAAAALYSPTGLTSAWANCSGICYKLSWTAPGTNNGNGYAISGMNNGTSSACPASAVSYTTYVGSTASTNYTDSGGLALGAQGTYACYLVRSAYNPAGAPPWAGVPSWTSQSSLATIAVKLGIYNVQTGAALSAAAGNVTPTLPGASQAGNLLVFTGWDFSCAACGFSAPAGWVRATRIFGALTGWSEIWYYPFNPGGISSATFTSTGTSSEGQLTEWSGVYGTSPLDQTGSLYNAGSVTTVTVSTSSPTTVVGDLAITNFENGGSGTYGASPSGWSNLSTDNFNGMRSDYSVTGSTATVSEKATFSLASSWMATVATFKATKFAIQQVQTGTALSSASGSVTPTLPGASTTGNLLVFSGSNNSAAAAGFSGPAGWIRATRIRQTTAFWVEIWYYPNNPGSISSAAFTSPGTVSEGVLSEYSGASASSPLDQTGTNTATTGTALTVSASGATSAMGGLVVTVFKKNTTTGTFTSPSAWTHLGNDPAHGFVSDYTQVGSVQIASEAMTHSVSSAWAAAVAAFK